MFDWDDQELANIIWGENSGADDHIVPFPEDIEKKDLPHYGDNDRKKLNVEDTNSKAAEQNTTASKSFSNVYKQENNDGLSASKLLVDPQCDVPSFAASDTDNNATAEKNQLDIGSEISQTQHENKELGELVGNSWANIGSFDDLDRIFSNGDLDGHTSLGSSDDLWPSYKNLASGAKSSSQALGSTSWEFGGLGNTSAHFKINSESLHNENSPTPGCKKTDGMSSYTGRNFAKHVKQQEYAVGTTSLVKEKASSGIKTASGSHLASEIVATPKKSADTANWSKTQPKHVQRTAEIADPRLLQGTYETWPSAAIVPQYDCQGAPGTVPNYPASGPSQKRLRHDSSLMAYQRYTNTYVASYEHGSFAHQHPAMYMLKLTDDEHQSMLSNSEVCPANLNKSVETPAGSVIMTPQEKIEKLRRRQQMRAMLAIQKQQQQLGHEASSVDYTLPHKICAEDQALNMEKSDYEADERSSILPCYDPGSPNKKDDPSTISDIDEYSAEDTVVHNLQDVIARLDLKTRLCVRDSLYRLAHSAMQRSHTSDTSSANKSIIYEAHVAKEELSNNDRFVGKTNVEAETNHIDRIVAHLLFRQHSKLPVKHVETPESSTSTKLPNEQETASPSSLLVGFPSKIAKTEHNLSPHGSKASRPFVDPNDDDILNDNPQKDVRINLQTEKNAEHAD